MALTNVPRSPSTVRLLCGSGVRLECGDLRAALRDRVHVGGGAAYVDDHQIAQYLRQPFRRNRRRPRCRS